MERRDELKMKTVSTLGDRTTQGKEIEARLFSSAMKADIEPKSQLNIRHGRVRFRVDRFHLPNVSQFCA